MIESEREARVRQSYPRFVIEDACKIDSIDGVCRGFDLAATQAKKLPNRALYYAVGKGALSVMEYLSEHPGKPSLEHIGPDLVWPSASIPRLDILVRHGWDISQRSNDRDERDCQSRLLNLIRHDDEMMYWALEHGATVSGELKDNVNQCKDPYQGWYIAPSLLDSVASCGSLEMMKHLYALGARPGRITPYNAARRAGYRPTQTDMEIVRYLIEGLHVDVNQRDVVPRYTRLMAFGMYAVRAHAAEMGVS